MAALIREQREWRHDLCLSAKTSTNQPSAIDIMWLMTTRDNRHSSLMAVFSRISHFFVVMIGLTLGCVKVNCQTLWSRHHNIMVVYKRYVYTILPYSVGGAWPSIETIVLSCNYFDRWKCNDIVQAIIIIITISLDWWVLARVLCIVLLTDLLSLVNQFVKKSKNGNMLQYALLL